MNSEKQRATSNSIIEISMLTETIINNNDSYSIEDDKESPKSRNMNIYPYEPGILSKGLENIIPQGLYHSKGAIEKNPYDKFDIQQLAYSIIKDYSQLKISKDEAFMSRMEFDIYKRQIQSRRINQLVEEQQYKICEEDKIRAFNRLIADTNRRLYVKENLSLMKDKLEEEILETAPRTYRANEWNEIYIDRFKKYDEERKRKNEQKKQEEKSKKLIQEKEEVNMVKTRKEPWEKIEKAAKIMHDQAEIKRIKLEIAKRKAYEKFKKKNFGLINSRNAKKNFLKASSSVEDVFEDEPQILYKDQLKEIISPTEHASNYFNSQTISKKSLLKSQDFINNELIKKEYKESRINIDNGVNDNSNVNLSIIVNNKIDDKPSNLNITTKGKSQANSKGQCYGKANIKDKNIQSNIKTDTKSIGNKKNITLNKKNMSDRNNHNDTNKDIILKSKSTSYMKTNKPLVQTQYKFSQIEAKQKELDIGIPLRQSFECLDFKSISLKKHNHSSSVKSKSNPYQFKQNTQTNKINNDIPKQIKEDNKLRGYSSLKAFKPIKQKKNK